MLKRCFFILCFGLSAYSYSEKPIVIAISDFPPLINAEEDNYGTHGELVFKALRTTNIPYTIHTYSWSKIGDLLNHENICSFGWIKTDKRLAHWQFSVPYHVEEIYLWGRKDSKIQLNAIEQALQYRIGVTRGYSYGREFDSLLSDIDTDEALEDKINIKKLLAGRIDLFPSQTIIVEPIVEEYFPEQIGDLEPKLYLTQLSHHFVCTKNFPQGKAVIDKINTLLPKRTN